LLANSAFDFPFLLCWANESWTRRWDGLESDVLLRQEYPPGDDERHIDHLLPIFKDPRYYKLGGRPLFLVYRFEDLPDPPGTAARWRRAVRRAGFPDLYLLRVEGFQADCDPAALGCDAAVEFAPDWRCLGPRVYLDMVGAWSETEAGAHPGTVANRVFLYENVVRAMRAKPRVGYRRYPGVFPAWDNAARRRQGGATVLHGATPALFETFLADTATALGKEFPPEERHLFINAWNEWGEGCHLEPDRRFGTAWLEAVRRVANGSRSGRS
jgi:lipopolysaccharide biosynthesis protein